MPHCFEKIPKMPTEGFAKEGNLCKHISGCIQRLPNSCTGHKLMDMKRKKRLWLGGKGVFLMDDFCSEQTVVLYNFCVEITYYFRIQVFSGIKLVLVLCDVRTAADLKGSSMCFIICLTRTDEFPPHSQERGYYFKTFLYKYMRAGRNFHWTRPDELV